MEHGRHHKGKAPEGRHKMKGNGKMMPGKTHGVYMAAEKKAKKAKK